MLISNLYPNGIGMILFMSNTFSLAKFNYAPTTAENAGQNLCLAEKDNLPFQSIFALRSVLSQGLTCPPTTTLVLSSTKSLLAVAPT